MDVQASLPHLCAQDHGADPPVNYAEPCGKCGK